MISILDYGIGNLGSIVNMLKKIGVPAQLVAAPEALLQAEKILLPGVGSFDPAMQALHDRGLVPALVHKARVDRTPILGICLGMQLLGLGSQEGSAPGLGLIDARCRRLTPADPKIKVPHMGWNTVNRTGSCRLLDGLDDSPRFYFVHSYYMECANPQDSVAESHHGGTFTCMVQQENVMGAQFHPEKSHRFGMQLLSNFAAF